MNITLNSEVKFNNGLKGVVKEVWANGTYVVQPQYPAKSIIPFMATRLTMNPNTHHPYGYEFNLGWVVVDVIPARKTKAKRKNNFHEFGAYCPLKNL